MARCTTMLDIGAVRVSTDGKVDAATVASDPVSEEI